MNRPSISDKRLTRAQIMRAIRDYFADQGFVETDTPSLVLSPGMEPHIRPVEVKAGEGAAAEERVFLPTSPEFAMKRLLAQGYSKIFQLCKAYRFEPISTTHNPEFTMLEWYRGNSGFEAIMDDVEELFARIAREVHGSTCFQATTGTQDVSRPWPRLTVEQCFERFAGISLVNDDLFEACRARGWLSSGASRESVQWDDLFFLVMMNAVEPELARLGKPAIVYLYPESQAALSNLVTDERGLRWAKRFEVYAGGLELGNAFDELVDAAQQRKRFEKDMALRKELYGESFAANPIDEQFLAALKDMPPSGGIAMGVDRIVMYFTAAESIHDVLWLGSHWWK